MKPHGMEIRSCHTAKEENCEKMKVSATSIVVESDVLSVRRPGREHITHRSSRQPVQYTSECRISV
ncbi:hypothetical protein M433DRAFT_475880 [Acidomyces richmondensis BFW]|nr:hypothetical protein M433DRAFT_475880 [Acidomyces richmondensis BFW]